MRKVVFRGGKMTKERLEELIKQRAKVWDEFWHEEVQLDPSNCTIVGKSIVKIRYVLYVKEDEDHCPSYELDNLREDLERAKAEYDWKEKIYTERTERFEPPMWEDIKVEDGYEFKFFDANNEYYAFRVIKNTYTVICVDDFKNIFEEVSTKENYEKACEIVRNLFKGEK